MIGWLSNKYYRPVGFRLAEVFLFGILPQVIQKRLHCQKEKEMFNYRVKYLTPEEIYSEVRRFCKDKHSIEDLLQHCHDTLGKMLTCNEETLFFKAQNLDVLWETIAYEYANHAKDIWFPNRKLVQGPKYVSSMKDSGENDSSSFYNLDSTLQLFEK